MQLDKVADAGLALGVLNQNEADLLRRAEESRLRTINVDDFDPIDLVANKTLFEPSAYHRAAWYAENEPDASHVEAFFMDLDHDDNKEISQIKFYFSISFLSLVKQLM